jgi:hypothetical protein
MIATWLQEHLENCGRWDTDGVSRAARARRCRSCRQYVLTGLDADRCALPVAVDPDALSARGEAIAILAGKSTYSLRWLSNRLELDRRNRWEIAGASRRLDVLAGHLCGQPSLGTVPGLGAESRIALPSPVIGLDNAPF